MGLYRWAVLKLAGYMGLLKPRRYRVMLFGESLGTYLMPRGHHMPNPNAEDRPVLTRPFHNTNHETFTLEWYERMPNGNIRIFQWAPETAEDRDAAERFYRGAHGLRPDGRPDPDKQPPILARTAEEVRLIAAVRADRDNDLAYLDYAAWLTARKDSYGEYIRLSVEIRKLPKDTPQRERLESRRFELSMKHGPRLVRPFTDLGFTEWFTFFDPEDVVFFDYGYSDRGVVEELHIQERDNTFPHNVARLLAAAPFARHLHISRRDLTLADIVPVPAMTQIEKLEVLVGSGTADDFRRFAGSPHLSGLRELKLMGTPVGTEGAVELAHAAWLQNVRSLDLSACQLTEEGLEALAESPYLGQVTDLIIDGNHLYDRAVAALAAAPALTNLTRLILRGWDEQYSDFRWPGCSATSLTALGQTAFAPKLTCLVLDHYLRSPGCAEALASGAFGSMRVLSVNHAPFGPDGLTALFRAPWFRELESFSAAGALGSDPAAAAFAALGFIALRSLDLTSNALTDAGVAALVGSSAAARLTVLTLSNNPFGAPGAKALADAPLAELEVLDLANVKIGPDGAKALAASPHFPKLTCLVVMEESVGLAGREALMKRFTDQVVRCC
jgi:uncharacterized protein (TIGR02996 family)